MIGATVIDTQVASNEFFQDDLLKRLHEYKPTDMGLPALPGRASARRRATACCRSIGIGGYQGISSGASAPATRTTNFQGTVNITQRAGRAHAAGGRRCAHGAARARPRRQPVRAACVHQRVHASGQRHRAAHAEQPRACRMAAFMLGIPSTASATIQPTTHHAQQLSSRPTGRTRGA